MTQFRNACPRHCYGSCAMFSNVKGERLIRVIGDSKHGYTQGSLCAKGYSLIQYTLDDYRLRYPLKQLRRGSGEWRRISWDQAYDIISLKIIELNKTFGSNKAIGYYKGTGNIGLLHHAVEGMFAGLGSCTNLTGNICADTGIHVLEKTMGSFPHPDPEDMHKANLIVIWGGNPTSTNINLMRIIYKARKDKSVPLVVIDPVFTNTAKRADYYFQIEPHSDEWLALGIAKRLVEVKHIDEGFIKEHTCGYAEFARELDRLLIDEVLSHTGLSTEAFDCLCKLFLEHNAIACLTGFGMQRYRGAGKAVNAISALIALTGSYYTAGGGLYFYNKAYTDPAEFMIEYCKPHSTDGEGRFVNINTFPQEALGLQDPPLKMLWVSCANPLSQGFDLAAWYDLFSQLELVVCVDLYLTKTARQADIVLPAASFFEEEDLIVSFWHNWLTLNEKTLPSFYESKSDLQIARELSSYINRIKPGFSAFPSEMNALDWICKFFIPQMEDEYGFNSIDDLRKQSFKKIKEPLPDTWRYCFDSSLLSDLHSEISLSVCDYPYYLLTPQSLLKFHSQYETLTWLNPMQKKMPTAEISSHIASNQEIRNGDTIEVCSARGSMLSEACVNAKLPNNVVYVEQSDRFCVNNLFGGSFPSAESCPFFDCKVRIRKVSPYEQPEGFSC
ncbi:MAG: molybdopterin-dependent oxidoreductase [Coriobacteriales bacterium]|nr:molybdopterin-dependent oxidoreductase [Coriobacteriales bacterium]